MTADLSKKSLESLCQLVTDGTHDSPKLQSEGVPFIKGKHISGGFIDFENCDYITYEDHLKVIARSKPEQGDTLFSNIGSVGDVAYVTTTKEFSIKNVALFKPDREKVDPRYLYYLLKSPDVQGGLLSHRSGSAQPFIGLSVLRQYKVHYHASLPVQHRIASILSAYDDLIANNTRRIAILEEMARRLYEEWFVHFRFPGHEGIRMVESEIGEVPEGWEPTKLGDFAIEVRESIDPATVPPETPYVGLEHIPRRSITLSQWGDPASVDSTKLRFRRGEILFGKIRPYFHKVSVAPFDGICSSDTIVIRPTEKRWFAMVLCCTSSDRFVDHASQTSQGTKMPRANWKVLTEYPLPRPPTERLEQFNSFVEAIVDQTRTLMLQSANLRAQRDLLLPKLISGEIDVSEVPQPDEEVEAA